MRSISHKWCVSGFCLLIFLVGLILFGLGFKPVVAKSTPLAEIDYITRMGGSITSVAVSGSIAYVGQGATFAALDISNPGEITLLDAIPLPDFAEQIRVIDSLAYVADGEGGLQIIDVHNPNNLSVRGNHITTEGMHDVAVVDSFVYVADTSSMKIIDVADPAMPVLIGSFIVPYGRCFGIEVIGDLAYVAGTRNLYIVDVSNPAQPQHIGSYTVWMDVADVQVKENLAILQLTIASFDEVELHVVDISTPTNPVLLGKYSNSFVFSMYPRLQVMGNLAFAAWGNDGIEVIDFSIPTMPTRLATYEYNAVDLQITASLAYLAVDFEEFKILDISSLTKPILQGSYSLFCFLNDVHLQPPYLYTTDYREKLNILNVSNPADPVLLTAESATSRFSHYGGNDLKVIGNLAYLNRFNYGFEIFDVIIPTQPMLLSSYHPDSHGSYTAMTVSGSHAYIGELGTGINILDVSDPRMPVYVSTASLHPYPWPVRMKALDNYIYVADRQGGLFIVDTSDPSLPRVVGSYTNLDFIGVDVKGTLAYMINDSFNYRGLYILDVSNPATPVLVGHYAASNTAFSEIMIVDHLAFIADRAHGLLVIDVTDPANPSLFAQYDIPGGARGVDISGDYIYLAAQDSGLWVLRLANWMPPVDLPAETPSPQDMAELRNWFFIPFLQKK
jgi:hypothetical protein